MDAYFKATPQNYPVLVISFQTRELKPVPLCFFVMKAWNSENVLTALKILFQRLGSLKSCCFMIDVDMVEISALSSQGIRICLCKWHLLKARGHQLSTKTTEQRCKIDQVLRKMFSVSNEEEYVCLWEQIRETDTSFSRYFTFYHENRSLWTGPNRLNDIGLWNTNNASEGIIRSLQSWTGEDRCSIDKLIHSIEQYFEDVCVRLEENRHPRCTSTIYNELERNSEKGWNIINEVYVLNDNYQIHNHQVVLEPNFSCSCPYYLQRARICKHLFACIFVRGNAQRKPPCPFEILRDAAQLSGIPQVDNNLPSFRELKDQEPSIQRGPGRPKKTYSKSKGTIILEHDDGKFYFGRKNKEHIRADQREELLHLKKHMQDCFHAQIKKRKITGEVNSIKFNGILYRKNERGKWVKAAHSYKE